MANTNVDLLHQWLNEELPLDNNEITDEELSDDEDRNITKGKDFFFWTIIIHLMKIK